MYGTSMRYLLGILIGLGLIVLVFVLILKSLGGGKPTPSKLIDPVTFANTNVVAQLVLDGRINADQDHRTVKIMVSQNQTEINIIQGYQNTIITTQVYPSNSTAYAVFLQSLNRLQFTQGKSDPALGDERGFCPEGNRYIYSLVNGSDTLMRYWSTSCGSQGTFGGKAGQVRRLFENQIPDYSTLTQNIVGLTS